ncbi:hypothetical protein I7I51_03964 [Histoplasma capsulatum]|uniref:Fungal N-terminal domain-containing protein n=1 Tax=Ajellomyces capsulatus TaxID=5037 RepID=A0A8A1MCB4_AJECA|nr:hypothetical protein I7I51_03964 [Histoplasma capsulatum]
MSSEIAPILQVTGLGLKLSLSLNTVACEVAADGIDVHSIAKGVSLYVTALKHVGQSLQAADSSHSSSALRTAQEISKQSQSIFSDFEKMLEQSKRKDGGSVQERFKRCFRKQHVMYLLAHLEALKLSLMVMFQILQLGRLLKRNTSNSVGTDTIQEIDDLVTQWTQVGGFQELHAETRRRHHVSYASDMENDDCRNGLEGRGTQGQRADLECIASRGRRPYRQAAKLATEFRNDYSSLQARVDSDTEESSDIDAQTRRGKTVRFSPSANTSVTEERNNHRRNGGPISIYTGRDKPKTSPSQVRIPTPEFHADKQQKSYGHPHALPSSPRTLPGAIPERQPQIYRTSNLSPSTGPCSLASSPTRRQYTSNAYPSSHSYHNATPAPSYSPPIDTGNQPYTNTSFSTEHPYYQQNHHVDSHSRRRSYNYATVQPPRERQPRTTTQNDGSFSNDH